MHPRDLGRRPTLVSSCVATSWATVSQRQWSYWGSRIAGAAKEFKGSVKESIGKATGDAKLEADGNAEKVEGKVENAIGGFKDALKK